MSGRYKELPPTFYVPNRERKMVQVGKPGHYEYVEGTEQQYEEATGCMRGAYIEAYDWYQTLLELGTAKELARVVLPVGTYSAQFATCNPRSLMAFLSLRTKHPESKFPSFPQREIEMVAEQMEAQFATLFPLTYRAFCENGRVAP
jgi:thymidylate synthase (FAD)